MTRADLAIVGAGPAGMAAAAKAAELGLSVTLLDEQARAGGQVYRDVVRVAPLRGAILGKDYCHGTKLTTALKHDSIHHIDRAVVWAIEDGFRVSYTRDGRAAQTQAEHLLFATGALERPMPLAGWTLPGVMTAGAGQIMLKQSGVLARNAVLVGSGPLLYLIASQMIRAGCPPQAMVETQTWRDLLRASTRLGGALRGWPYMLKGLKMLGEIARARVPRFIGASGISVVGDEKAEAVRFSHRGQVRQLDCDTVFLHHGVVPNTQAARSIGVTHNWDAAQSCFVPQLDAWGQSDVAGVYIAGDSGGIGGAKAAELAGQLSALQIACEAGKLSPLDRDRQAAVMRPVLHRELAARPFLDRAYPPAAEALQPTGDTVVCRCEEVTARDIRGYAKLGCLGPNQAKAMGRVGMGPCQGRYCGLTVTTLLAEANNQSPEQTGYYRIRPPLKPITLGELASMETATESQQTEI